MPPFLPPSVRRLATSMIVAAVCGPAVAAPDTCGAAPPQLLVERFISADCPACWSASPPMPRGAKASAGAGNGAFALDWIVPGARGDEAPLSAAALPEAAERARRLGVPGSDETVTQTTPLAARSALRLSVYDGPAWNGYIGLQLRAGVGTPRPLPPGVVAYLGLVERIPAGTENTPVARAVVRAVMGPLPLDGLAVGRDVEHLRAARLPDTAKPERLSVVGWLETPQGRVLAVAGRTPHDCEAPP